MIKKMIDWINYWFIEPLKPSFTKEITTRHFKKKKFPISFKWGFIIMEHDSLEPLYFKIFIPILLMVYIYCIILFIFIFLIKFELNSHFVINILHYGYKPVLILSIPFGRRIGRNLYRAMVDEYCIKKLKWDD